MTAMNNQGTQRADPAKRLECGPPKGPLWAGRTALPARWTEFPMSVRALNLCSPHRKAPARADALHTLARSRRISGQMPAGCRCREATAVFGFNGQRGARGAVR
jgi:hypothetical protein